MVNFELQKAKKKIRQAIDGKYAQKTVATVAAAVGTRHVAIDGNLASATLPDGSSGAVEVVNAGRLASARYELRSGGTVSVVSGGGGGSGGGSGGISFSEADTRYYTKSQLDIGQLDTRYYTETESDALFVPVTRTVTGSGSLAGGGALSANQTLTLNTPGALSATTTNSSTTNHTHSIDSTIARSAINIGVSGLGLSGGGNLTANRTITLASSSNPGAAQAILASTAAGGLTLATLATTGAISGATNTNTAHTLGYATVGNVGFTGFAGFAANAFANTTGYALAQYNTDGTLYINSPTTINIRNSNNQLAAFGSTGLVVESGKLIGSSGYVSGWAGSGWRADQNISVAGQSFAEFDNLSIRGTLSVYELVINQIRATNGTLIVSSAGKIDSVSGSDWTFEDPNASNLCAFAVNDLVIIQSVDVNASTIVKRIVRRVSAVSGKTITVTAATGGPTDTGTAVAGDTVVRFGNTSNAARQGVVLITSDMSNSPYQDVISGVTSWADWTGGTKTRVRMGHLSGITGTANEYGLLAGNGFTAADSWVKFSTSAVLQNNVDSAWYKAGSKFLTIDPTNGAQITVNAVTDTIARSYGFVNSASTDISSVSGYYDSVNSINALDLGSYAANMHNSVYITANSGSPYIGAIYLQAYGAGDQASFFVDSQRSTDAIGASVTPRSVLFGKADEVDLYAPVAQFGQDTTKRLWIEDTYTNRGGNHSEIVNDTGAYKTLMLVGNRSFDSTNRRVDIYDQAYVSSTIEVGQGRTSGNISRFTGRNTTVSSISLTATTGFYGAAIGFNAHHANDSVSPTASGAFKFLGTQYTGNVTRPGMQFWDGNNGIMSWYYGEAGLASSADVTTWTKTFEISTTLVNSQLPITVSGGTELIKLNGSGTSGNSSTGYIAFYDSNTTTRRGFIGDVSSANTDIYLRADTSALHLGDSTSGDVIVLSSGGTKILGNIGFYNTTPIAKQTVTGSRGGNAALASLLTALASHGLITNSSTA